MKNENKSCLLKLNGGHVQMKLVRSLDDIKIRLSQLMKETGDLDKACIQLDLEGFIIRESEMW